MYLTLKFLFQVVTWGCSWPQLRLRRLTNPPTLIRKIRENCDVIIARLHHNSAWPFRWFAFRVIIILHTTKIKITHAWDIKTNIQLRREFEFNGMGLIKTLPLSSRALVATKKSTFLRLPKWILRNMGFH